MVDRTIESQSFRNTIDENIVNDIFSIEDAGTKRRVQFTVNDKDYVIFIQSFKLADKPWKIFGFCAKNEFESQVRAVDLKYIVVASLTLILVILMMPLLKLLIMNESRKASCDQCMVLRIFAPSWKLLSSTNGAYGK